MNTATFTTTVPQAIVVGDTIKVPTYAGYTVAVKVTGIRKDGNVTIFDTRDAAGDRGEYGRRKDQTVKVLR